MTKGRYARRRFLTLLAVSGAALLTAGPAALAAFDSEEEIPVAKVPAQARAAADKAAPKAKWTSATRHDVEGEISFELEGTDARGRNLWVTVYEDGTVDEVSTEIPAKEVPAPVLDALKAKMPRFKASGSYEVRQKGKVIRYDFEGKRPRDKEEISVSVTPDGKSVEIDD